MANVTVYNMEGNEVGTMELNDAVFGVEINEHLVHLAVVRQLANNRQGTQKAKTRSEVSGGGRKPWRQKGTGRARQGSIRAPQWIKGGIALGPKPRSYKYTVNKKEKRLAIIHFADRDIFLRHPGPFFQKDSKECLTEGNGRAKVMKSLRAMVL